MKATIYLQNFPEKKSLWKSLCYKCKICSIMLFAANLAVK